MSDSKKSKKSDLANKQKSAKKEKSSSKKDKIKKDKSSNKSVEKDATPELPFPVTENYSVFPDDGPASPKPRTVAYNAFPSRSASSLSNLNDNSAYTAFPTTPPLQASVYAYFPTDAGDDTPPETFTPPVTAVVPNSNPMILMPKKMDGYSVSESLSAYCNMFKKEESSEVYFAEEVVADDSASHTSNFGARLAYIEDRLRRLEAIPPEKLPAQAPQEVETKAYNKDDYVYNSLLQKILHESDETTALYSLSALGDNFVHLATFYGRIIISERCLTNEQKSIKPTNVGGTAGGEKFLVQGILFKYALDVQIGTNQGSPRWMYGGAERNDALAMKAAGNELVGLSNFITAKVNVINYPLMANIDYCGYRLVAVSTLPIGKDTLVYGSADAGKSVHNKDKVVNAAMTELGKALNLKEHLVSDVRITGPGDIEVHKGKDGRYYMLDFARMMPPEAPTDPKNPQYIFSKLMRPEFVKAYEKPLSSDAFSGWQSYDPEKDIHNKEVVEATKFLYQDVIGKIPERLCDSGFNYYFKGEICHVSLLHKSGINFRHLGRVRKVVHASNRFADTENFYDVAYLGEMVVRTLKAHLQLRWRQIMGTLKLYAEEPFKQELVRTLNLFAETHQGNNLFWQTEIKDLVRAKFGKEAILPHEEANDYHLLSSITAQGRLMCFQRLMMYLGVTLEDGVIEDLEYCLENDQEFEFNVQDIRSVEPKVKYMNLIDLAFGSAAYYQAVSSLSARPRSNYRLLGEAKQRLLNGFIRVSTCSSTQHFYANCSHEMGKYSLEEAPVLFGRASLLLTFLEKNPHVDQKLLAMDRVRAGFKNKILEKEPFPFEEAALPILKSLLEEDESKMMTYLLDDLANWVHILQFDTKTEKEAKRALVTKIESELLKLLEECSLKAKKYTNDFATRISTCKYLIDT